MLKPVRLYQAGIVVAALGAAIWISTDARAQTVGAIPAQSGCCEGGSATGANEWTTGNATSADWPAVPARTPSGMIFGKAPAPETGWWSHGEIEFGLRGFTSAPPRDGSGAYNSNVWQQGRNLAKYYQYSTIAPGAFAGGHVATGSNDGLYRADLWANNVGYSDQAYLLTLSKIGEQYLTLQWDQTPHLYSTTAQTPFAGTTNLTVPAQQSSVAALVAAGGLHRTDIGIERDTASISYRWTPTEAWDFHFDYSHLSRTGTQADGGVIGLPATSAGNTTVSNYVMVPTPVHDSTQNYEANGEYVGTSFWGQRYTMKLGYRGSTYHDDSLSYDIENPITTNPVLFARESLWPDNQANGFVGTLAADLPHHSRYVGTLDFTSMTQNSSFIPMSANYFGGGTSVNPLPANSLNGEINTFLSNNVMTTKITPELTNKLTYRYYNFDNETPQLLFYQWISFDQTACCGEGAIRSLTMKYDKQDASEALNWRPSKYWNLNANYNFERYDWTQADVTATNENSGKISVDYKPFVWLTARASGSYGYRTYENYSYANNVWSIQFPQGPLPSICGPNPPGNAPCNASVSGYASAYRQFMFDNRRQSRAQFVLDVVLLPRVTVSPTVKYGDDYYGLNPAYQEGINDRNSLSWGLDVAYAAGSDLNLVLSYYKEYGYMSMYGVNITGACGNIGCGPGAAGTTPYSASDHASIDTVSAGARWAAIPGKLQLDLRLALSKGSDQELLVQQGGAPPTGGQFPADTTWFTHLDASAIYKFDPVWVRSLGWKGDLKAKFRYTWERNSVSNWQNDSVLPFSTTQGTNLLLLASDNPNYNVQMFAASLVASW